MLRISAIKMIADFVRKSSGICPCSPSSTPPRPPQDFLLRSLALDHVILALGLGLGELLGLLAGLEPSRDAIL